MGQQTQLELFMSIGARLKEWRTLNNLKQDEASDKLGIPFSTLKKYEMNSRKPGAEAIEVLVKEGVNANWILTGIGPMLIADYSTAKSPAPDKATGNIIGKLETTSRTMETQLGKVPSQPSSTETEQTRSVSAATEPAQPSSTETEQTQSVSAATEPSQPSSTETEQAQSVGAATEPAPCPVDIKRLTEAIDVIEQELIKRSRSMRPAAKARAIVLAYQILEDEDKEKDRASYEYAQKMMTKLIKSIS